MVLHLPQAQQRADDAKQRVDLGKRLIRDGGECRGIGSIAQPPIDPGAQARERRPHLVRDVVTDPAHVAHQLLQAIKHRVDMRAQ